MRRRHDPDADIHRYFQDNAKSLQCCVCGKEGVLYAPNGPNDNINREHGGWCSFACFKAEAEAS
jgi:hypothetical protein